mmetsp:Transcript_18991/g.48450  ORF Transcript_18991/g.48450 Transcript_18991/m.48450 type:complete len:271 (+) Transcript_18991:534-1346(+)
MKYSSSIARRRCDNGTNAEKASLSTVFVSSFFHILLSDIDNFEMAASFSMPFDRFGAAEPELDTPSGTTVRLARRFSGGLLATATLPEELLLALTLSPSWRILGEKKKAAAHMNSENSAKDMESGGGRKSESALATLVSKKKVDCSRVIVGGSRISAPFPPAGRLPGMGSNIVSSSSFPSSSSLTAASFFPLGLPSGSILKLLFARATLFQCSCRLSLFTCKNIFCTSPLSIAYSPPFAPAGAISSLSRSIASNPSMLRYFSFLCSTPFE